MSESDKLVDVLVSDIRKSQKRTAVLMIVMTALIVIVGLCVILYSTREVKQKIEKTETLEKQLVQVEIEKKEQTEKLAVQTEKLNASQKALEAARLDPTRAGIKAYHQGKYKEAIASYDRALEKAPNDAYVWNLKGYSLFKAKRYNESVQALLKAVEVDPQYAWGYFDLARVYCAIKRPDAATEAMRHAIRLRPNLREIAAKDREFTKLCGSLVLE